METSAIALSGGAQVEGWMVPNADGSVSHQGAIWHDSRMAQAIQSGSLDSLRPLSGLHVNGVLREDEFEQFDRAVLNVYRDELVAYSDLDSRGLTFNLANAMGVTELKWEDSTDVGPATRSMYAGTAPLDDLSQFRTQRLPIPIISKGFHLDLRTLEAGRREGENIDVTNAERATRAVSESTDDLFFNGGFSNGGASVFGYRSFPRATSIALTPDWTGALQPNERNATGIEIVNHVIDMIDAAFQNNISGPFVLYLPYQSFGRLAEDFKEESDKSIRQRLMEIEELEAIRWTRRLAENTATLVAMRRDVVDGVTGFLPTLTQWETMGGMIVHFKVMSILVPRMKADAEDKAGIVNATFDGKASA